MVYPDQKLRGLLGVGEHIESIAIVRLRELLMRQGRVKPVELKLAEPDDLDLVRRAAEAAGTRKEALAPTARAVLERFDEAWPVSSAEAPGSALRVRLYNLLRLAANLIAMREGPMGERPAMREGRQVGRLRKGRGRSPGILPGGRPAEGFLPLDPPAGRDRGDCEALADEARSVGAGRGGSRGCAGADRVPGSGGQDRQ